MAKRDSDLAEPIKLILSDVDGVLTDGTIILDNSGVESKAFHVRDGMGIKLWQRNGLGFGILTARNSQIVKQRAAELSIDIVRQGCSNKLVTAKEVLSELSVKPEQVCYIGDDLPDLPVLNYVGLPVAVQDGAEEVRAAATWVMRSAGGRGAVRELIERIMRAKGCWDGAVDALSLQSQG